LADADGFVGADGVDRDVRARDSLVDLSELVALDPDDPEVSAAATAGSDAIAVPTPSAIASAPTRPM
jgi:hypothetical protein